MPAGVIVVLLFLAFLALAALGDWTAGPDPRTTTPVCARHQWARVEGRLVCLRCRQHPTESGREATG